MKPLIQLFLATTLLLVSTSGVSALKENPIPQSEALLQVIRDIGERYNVHFTYDREIVENVEIQEYEPDSYVNVEDALTNVLKNTKLKYVMLEMKYVIIYQDDAAGMKSLEQMVGVLQKIIEQKKEKRLVNSLDRLENSTDLRSIHLEKHRMVLNVSGSVTDKDGQPLIGVNIQVKGSNKGVATDLNGKFTIENVDENAVLIFSYIGYQKLEVSVAGKSNLAITLQEDLQTLDEVVVVGYGNQKKINVIGSVETISNEELKLSPVSNVSNTLAGRLPGATVIQESGEPGNNDAKILIRGIGTLGDASPLVVIDGIPGRDLNSLDPWDIESITILKDASAAIYGARSANGVILVTTKRGTSGEPKFSYEFFEGIKQPTVVPDLLNSFEYAVRKREGEIDQGFPENSLTFSTDDIAKYKEGLSGEFPWAYPNTNWWDATYKKWSNIRHHTFSVNGGSKSSTYYVSFGTQYENGSEKNSSFNFNRYNLKSNLDFDINKFLNIGLDINGVIRNKNAGSQGTLASMYGVVLSDPTSVAIFPNGLPGPDRALGWNPVIAATDITGFNDDKVYNLNSKINATFKVPGINDLSFVSYYSHDLYFNSNKLFTKPWTLYDLDKNAYLAAGNSGIEDGSEFMTILNRGPSSPILNDSYTDSKSSTFHIRAIYDRNFNSVHNVNAFLAFENQEYLSKGISGYREDFLSDKLPYLFAGGDERKTNASWVNIDAQANYFGRLMYNYDETYFFQFTFRRDGSLRFSKEHGRWGNFPGVIAGWIISNENFWKEHLKAVSFFKLRASWAEMGNDRVPAFQYLPSYQFGTGTALGSNRSYNSSLYQFNVPNPLITWEVANMLNAGFESRFLNNHFQFNIDFFYQRRNNILVKRNASVPSYIGLSLPDENYGIVDNKGFEIVMSYYDNLGDLSYSIKGTYTHSLNKVIEFDEPVKINDWQTLTGHPIGTQLLFNKIGVFNDSTMLESYPHLPGTKPGDIIIEDYNQDGKINNDDMVLIDETANPRSTYSIILNLTYKRWNLSTLFYGVGESMRQKNQGNYKIFSPDNRWTENIPTSDIPRTNSGHSSGVAVGGASTYNFIDAAYFRLKNLNISYRLPENIASKMFLKDVSFYVSGENLFLLSELRSPVDPELGQQGNQFSNYPLNRVLSVGIRAMF